MIQAVDVDLGPVVANGPGPVGDVGNAVLITQVVPSGESLIDHGEQAQAFVLIAIDDGRDFFVEVVNEDIGLAHHRTEVTHLEH